MTLLTDHLPLIAGAPDGIKKLRELILELAVRGKLVPQEQNDAPVSELLQRIAEEKSRLAAQGKIKEKNPLAEIGEDEKPFSVPAAWVWRRIGEVSTYIQRGKGPVYIDRSDFRVVSQKCVRWTGLDITPARFIAPESLEKYEEIRFLRQGDILWNSTGTGTIGRACVVDANLQGEELVADSHVTVVRVTGVLPVFLWRWIQTPTVQKEIEGSASGTTNQIELNTSNVIGHLIPVPPLAEQHRIVAKVHELMALCDTLESQQAHAENAHAQLVQALLDSLTQASDADDFAASWQRLSEHFDILFTTEASIDVLKQTVLQLAVMGKLVPQAAGDKPASDFARRIQAEKNNYLPEAKARRQKDLAGYSRGEPPFEVPANWVWRTVDEVMHVTGGVTLGRKLGSRKLVSKPYLRVANVQRGHLQMDQVKEVEVPEDEVIKYSLEMGDLLITEGGDWDKVGRTAIWRDELPECLHQNHVFRARAVVADWEPRWAEMYLNSTSARKYFAGSSKQTTNLASINMTQLRACAFPLPPLNEQVRIVAKVDALMSLCDQLQSGIRQARDLKQQLASALVQRAVA